MSSNSASKSARHGRNRATQMIRRQRRRISRDPAYVALMENLGLLQEGKLPPLSERVYNQGLSAVGAARRQGQERATSLSSGLASRGGGSIGGAGIGEGIAALVDAQTGTLISDTLTKAIQQEIGVNVAAVNALLGKEGLQAQQLPSLIEAGSTLAGTLLGEEELMFKFYEMLFKNITESGEGNKSGTTNIFKSIGNLFTPGSGQ